MDVGDHPVTNAKSALPAKAEWHFGTYENWKTASTATIVSEVWSQARPLLVARLKESKGSCGQLVFGRVVGSSSAPVIPFREVTGPVLGQARARVNAALSSKSRCEELDQSTGCRLARNDVNPSQSLLQVSINPDECAPQATHSTELTWRASLPGESAAFTSLSSGDSELRTASVAADLDGDGRLEAIHEGWPQEKIGITSFGTSGGQRWVSIEIPCFDCPC